MLCSNCKWSAISYIRQYANIARKELQPKKDNSNIFSASYCRNLVEKNDHENYLCTLLLDGAKRRHAFALRAFNVEVAKCGDAVSEPHISKIKLKFWHDAIDKCYAQQKSYVEDHPVLKELKQTVDANKLSKSYLKRLVTARDRSPSQQFVSLKQLEDYAEQAFSSLYYLLAEMSGVRNLNVDHALSHLGKAQGIATLLRAIPYCGRSQAPSIPQETLIRHGVSQERILRCKPDDKGVEECIFEVATAAHQHLEQARNLASHVPKQLRNILLPAIAVERYLERLRRANFSITNPNCLQRDAMLPMWLYWHKLRGKY